MKNIIYGLVDPRDLLVHYVGKSTSGLTRPLSHRRKTVNGSLQVSTWLRDLRDSNLEYQVIVLEETPVEMLGDAEREWIARGRAAGWPLTNLLPGGNGAPRGDTNPSKLPHVRVMKKIWTKAYANGPAHQKRMREANPLFDPEIKARQQAATRAALQRPEIRAKLSHAAHNRTPQHEARRRAGILAAHKRPEVIAKRAAVVAAKKART